MSNLPSRFNLRSIRSQVITAFLVMIIAVGVLESFALFQVRQLNKDSLKEDFNNLQKVVDNMGRASNEFILKDRTNDEFMQTGKSIYLSRFNEAYLTFHQTLDNTKVALANSGFTDHVELEALRLAVVMFDTTFQHYQKTVRSRGKGNYGIISEFDTALGEITRFDFGQENEVLLNLRLLVKEYQLTGDEEVIDNAKFITYRFSRVLEKYITDEQAEEVLDALVRYEESFNQLVEADSILGMYSGEGLQGALSEQMKDIDDRAAMRETQAKIAKTYNRWVNEIWISLVVIFLTTAVLALIIVYILYKGIIQPIDELKNIVKQMGKGSIPDQITTFRTKEVAEMAQNVTQLAQVMKDTADFAGNIGQGNYQTSFAPLGDRDILGNALVKMRDNLEEVAQEETKRRWANEGYTQFMDIIRSEGHSLEQISDSLLTAMVGYVSANQGALFVLNDEEPEDLHLEMKACYAWKRKKHLDRRINLGEGLLGQTWFEKKTIFLTEIPGNYITITSGLGKAVPTSIVIVPLKHNDNIMGVIELASFNTFQSYEIAFIEKIAEIIAGALSSLKTSEMTRTLLDESDKNAEILKAQEEEMKQNMEEMQATHEEMVRKEKEYIDIIEALKSPLQNHVAEEYHSSPES